ncbi:ribosomal protein S7e [Artemisia annua]|uniref:40S ribosomal protein S7 n=1 Tax=Artemisia annua TaxID=35608 RepID=A0A2U1KYB1_ARTAN|nr:ribosomal protein S7e [Artemisia annua]
MDTPTIGARMCSEEFEEEWKGEEARERWKQALFDLENTHQELKSDLKDLYINSASQIDVVGDKKAVVVHVSYRLSKPFR